MKEYKGKIILTSIVTILPILIGLVLWNKLPDTIATHFGADNVPNGWSSKPFAVIGIPAILLVFHLFALGITLNDPKKRNIGKMMLSVIFWIIPVVSLVVNTATLSYAMGSKIDIGMIANILVGLMFIIMGNYMSKNRQNYTVGIRIPWTLGSEENWDRTHRFASKLWVIGGIIFVINAFVQSILILVVIILMTMIAPMIYSFVLYKRGN
ncbi:MAG: SdpI family protein [Oliverpabstia sp.]|nr:SdpI family protein [Oliverpabstia sp.]